MDILMLLQAFDVLGHHLNLQDINETAACAALYPATIDYLSSDSHERCEELIPDPHLIPSEHIKTAYMLLKDRIE